MRGLSTFTGSGSLNELDRFVVDVSPADVGDQETLAPFPEAPPPHFLHITEISDLVRMVNEELASKTEAAAALCLEDCSDGLDNDLDTATDCADPDCTEAATCQEDCGDGLDNDLDGDTDCEDSS